MLPDVLEHFRSLAADPDLPVRADVLLDLRRMTSLPDGEKIRAAAGEVERLRTLIVWGACAVVAASDALYGMGRVFATLIEPPFERTAVFRDVAAAESWLDSPNAPR